VPFISERSVGGNVEPRDMLAELCSDNQALIVSMRAAHELCDADNDVATTSLIETGLTRPSGASGFFMKLVALKCGDLPSVNRWDLSDLLGSQTRVTAI
jgi:hypothetical protein